jgi:hypothetical protein
MIKTPLILTAIFVLLALVAGIFIASDTLGLSGADLVNAEIAIFVCLGGAVSATFVIYSYIRTNESFIESQRPQLLLQVRSYHSKDPMNPNKTVPMTQVLYKNITSNRFADLNIQLTVSAQSNTVSLGDLFSSNMVMVGFDERQRSFNTLNELNSRNINVTSIARQGNEITLTTGYSYTYNRQLDEVIVNVYRWDPGLSEWQIA